MKKNDTVLELIDRFRDDYLKFYDTDRCLICDSPLSQGNITFFSKVWCDDLFSKVNILNCKSCGLGYTYPFLSKREEETLYQNYPQHYIHQNIMNNKMDISQKIIYLIENHMSKIFFSTNKTSLKKFLSCFLFQRLFQTYPIYFDSNNENTSVLDIGCGDGYFLNKAEKFGWDCYGTEYNDHLIRRLAVRGITAYKDIGEYINKKKFDVIRINHVLEHLEDPNRTLDVAYQLLKDKGSLIIGLPNFNTEAKIFKEFYALHLPYHRHHYTKQSIITLLKKHKFDILYYKTKSVGLLAVSLSRKYKNKQAMSFLRIFDILVSVIFDLFNQGDCIEVYAKK